MKQFWQKHSGLIITIAIILVIVFIIYHFGKSAGKKYVPDDVVIPPDTQPNGNPPGTTFNPGPYTDAIYEDLSCDFCLHSTTPYYSAMKLSNSQLAILYNDWNKRYAQEFDSQTIIQAITHEFTLYNVAWQQATADFVNRLRSIQGTQG